MRTLLKLSLVLALALPSFGACVLSRTVTVNNAKVASTLTGFPVGVIGTFNGTSGTPDLRSVAHGGKTPNADTNGYSIGYFSDSNCSTILPYQTVTFNATTGIDEFWVLPASVSTSNTPFYVRYGDPAITTDLSNPTAVWAGYRIVSHLVTAADATGNTTGTLHSTGAGTGQVGADTTFDGTNGWIDYGTTSALAFNGNTIEAWIKLTDNNLRIIADDEGTGSTGGGISFRQNNSGGPLYYEYLQDASNYALNATTAFLALNTFTHLAGTWDGTTIRLYVNGSAATMGTQSNSGTVTGGYTPGVMSVGGRAGTTSFRWTSDIDEFRISNVARSANWISASYNNQSSPSTFVAFGSEVGGGASPVKRMKVILN